METEKKEESTKPLAHPSTPSIFPIAGDEEVSGISRWRSAQYLRRRRRCALGCCGCCAAITVLLGLLILILSLTVFKIKDPTLTMNYVNVTQFEVGPGSDNRSISANLTLNANIEIRNPNVASFRFSNSTTDFYYEGQTMGVAYAPSGVVAADKTAEMNVTLDVLVDRVVAAAAAPPPNITEFVLGQDVNLTSYTDISGRVNVLGIYKRDIDVAMNCTILLFVSATGLEPKSTQCQANVN